LCEKACSDIFHISFKEKIICGKCIADLKEFLRIKKGMELVSLKEMRLKKELEKYKRSLRRKRTTLDETSDARTKSVFEKEILPVLKSVEYVAIAKRVNHERLIQVVKTILPFIYEEIFHTTFTSKIELKEKEIVENREVDLVLIKNQRPFMIIEIETPLPSDPYLHEIREKSLKDEIAHFASVVGTGNLVVVCYEEDEEIANICFNLGVKYFSLKPFAMKLANFVRYYEKLNSLWNSAKT
jgi:hypothetical protein